MEKTVSSQCSKPEVFSQRLSLGCTKQDSEISLRDGNMVCGWLSPRKSQHHLLMRQNPGKPTAGTAGEWMVIPPIPQKWSFQTFGLLTHPHLTIKFHQRSHSAPSPGSR